MTHLPDLYSLIPKCYFISSNSHLTGTYNCGLHSAEGNESGRFLNHVELTQVVSSADPGFEPKAV